MIGQEVYQAGFKLAVPALTAKPMTKFFNNVLAINSHYPEKKDIFKVFSHTNIHNIKMVVISAEPSIIPRNAKGYGFIDMENYGHDAVLDCIKNTDAENLNKSEEIDYAAWIDQGVFFLNLSLTIGADNSSHLSYWKDFIERVITEISMVSPSVWIVPENLVAFVRPNLRGKVFIVNPYTKETIERIPTLDNANYLIITPNALNKAEGEAYKNSNHFYFANKILQKTKNKKITW